MLTHNLTDSYSYKYSRKPYKRLIITQGARGCGAQTAAVVGTC